MESLIDEDGAQAFIIRGWLPKEEADLLCAKLLLDLPWVQEKIKFHGETYPVPRKQFFCSDEDMEPGYGSYKERWPPELQSLRERVEKETQVKFNSCIANLYESGEARIAPHSDREIRSGTPVVVISLGGPRRFYFKNKADGKRNIRTEVFSGDALIMAGRCQELWVHEIPRQQNAFLRISVTFRCLDDED